MCWPQGHAQESRNHLIRGKTNTFSRWKTTVEKRVTQRMFNGNVRRGIFIGIHGGFHSHGGIPKQTMFTLHNPMKMDDLMGGNRLYLWTPPYHDIPIQITWMLGCSHLNSIRLDPFTDLTDVLKLQHDMSQQLSNARHASVTKFKRRLY